MNKSWYTSKAVWSALLIGITGVAEAAGIHVPEYAFTVLAAFGLYGVRDAIK